MRSDYLGDCTVFTGLPEAINDGQYLTPRLTREECAMAIRGPARVCGGDVDAALVNQLLNDFGPDPDQLPLLQHALMRMWRRQAVAVATDGGGRVVLTIEDYTDQLGEALDRHAEEVYGELTKEQQRLAEVMFRRLTERARGQRDTRAPARLGEVAAIAGCRIEELEPVVEEFRQEGCNFVVAGDSPLRDASLLDIGHESLIRQWKRLSAWVDAEAESAASYVRLADSARRYEGGKADLCRSSTCSRPCSGRPMNVRAKPAASRYRNSARRARRTVTSSGAWKHSLRTAARTWDETQEALHREEEDERRRQLDEARREADTRAARADADRATAELALEKSQKLAADRRRRNIVLRAAVALLTLAVLGLWARSEYRRWALKETDTTYADYVSKRGVPRGIGPPLAADLASRRSVFLRHHDEVPPRKRLARPSTRANRRHVQDATAHSWRRMSGPGASSNRNAGRQRIWRTDDRAFRNRPRALAESDEPAARKPVLWKYIYDEEGRIAYEVEMDRKGQQVRSLVYSPADRRRRARSADPAALRRRRFSAASIEVGVCRGRDGRVLARGIRDAQSLQGSVRARCAGAVPRARAGGATR